MTTRSTEQQIEAAEFLRAQRAEVRRILAEIPPDDPASRHSFEARLKDIEQEIVSLATRVAGLVRT